MARFRTLPDLEAVAAARLRSAGISGLGTRVYSSIPNTPTYPLVVVERTGGTPPVRQGLDGAEIRVSVWGTSKAQAFDIAAQARVSLLELEGTQVTNPVSAWISGVDDGAGLAWQPDPTTARDRYVFSVTVYGH